MSIPATPRDNPNITDLSSIVFKGHFSLARLASAVKYVNLLFILLLYNLSQSYL